MGKNAEDIWLILAIIATNLVRIIVFWLAAVYFNRWWIIFFVLFFLEHIQVKKVDLKEYEELLKEEINNE